MVKHNVVLDKSFNFAVHVVDTYKELVKDYRLWMLFDQFVKSGTSVGANIDEGNNAQSKADFIHKFSIAQKECGESIYWIKLLTATGFISPQSTLKQEALEIYTILCSILITSKQRYGKK